MKIKETGNPVKNRSCLATVRGVGLPQSFHKGAGERGTEPGCRLYFIIKRLARHEPDGGWEKFFSFQFGCAFFMMSVIFMDGRVPGRKEEGTRWGFLIRQ